MSNISKIVDAITDNPYNDNAVKQLLSHIKSLQAERDRLREALEDMVRHMDISGYPKFSPLRLIATKALE